MSTVGPMDIWDEELVVHPHTYNPRTQTLEVRAILQATDGRGQRYRADRVFRMRLRKEAE